MACGKGSANKPIEDFITHSPAPVDLAAKMSQIYHELSFKVFNLTFKNLLNRLNDVSELNFKNTIFFKFFKMKGNLPFKLSMKDLFNPIY